MPRSIPVCLAHTVIWKGKINSKIVWVKIPGMISRYLKDVTLRNWNELIKDIVRRAQNLKKYPTCLDSYSVTSKKEGDAINYLWPFLKTCTLIAKNCKKWSKFLDLNFLRNVGKMVIHFIIEKVLKRNIIWVSETVYFPNEIFKNRSLCTHWVIKQGSKSAAPL